MSTFADLWEFYRKCTEVVMIEYGTWVAVAVLGFGSLALFAWFLTDLKRIMESLRRKGNR